MIEFKHFQKKHKWYISTANILEKTVIYFLSCHYNIIKVDASFFFGQITYLEPAQEISKHDVL